MKSIATLRAAQFITMYLYALVAGVFWGTWFSLSRSIASITPSTFLEVGHTMIRNLGVPMSLLMPTAILSNVALLVMLYRRRQMRAAGLATAALAPNVANVKNTVRAPLASRSGMEGTR